MLLSSGNESALLYLACPVFSLPPPPEGTYRRLLPVGMWTTLWATCVESRCVLRQGHPIWRPHHPPPILVLPSLPHPHPKSQSHHRRCPRELYPNIAARMPNSLADCSSLSTPSSLNVIPPPAPPPLVAIMTVVIVGRTITLEVWPHRHGLRGPRLVTLILVRPWHLTTKMKMKTMN